jgi:hypothetical protein
MCADYQHEPFETFDRLRRALRVDGYTPELDSMLERFQRNHPLWFDELVREGLVQVEFISPEKH